MAKKRKHPFAEEVIKATKDAIKEFGRYQFNDKGPDEVVRGLTQIGFDFETLPQAERVQVAKDLRRSENALNTLASAINDYNYDTKKITDSELKEIGEAGGEMFSEYLGIYDEDETDIPSPSIKVREDGVLEVTVHPLEDLEELLKGCKKNKK